MRHYYLIVFVIFSLLAGCDENFPPLVSVEVTDQGLSTSAPANKDMEAKRSAVKAI
jgi:hypothetical protein